MGRAWNCRWWQPRWNGCQKALPREFSLFFTPQKLFSGLQYIFYLFFFIFAIYFEPSLVVWTEHIDKRRFLDALVLTRWNFANFKLIVKNKAAGTPHVMIIHFCIYHLTWGFQRCSLRQSGQCEGLNAWNEWQNWLHVFFSLSLWLREPTALFYWSVMLVVA